MTSADMSPPDLLAEIGRALYGSQWQKYLADDLDISRETIRRWLSGHTPLERSHGMFRDLRDVMAERKARLEELLRILG